MDARLLKRGIAALCVAGMFAAGLATAKQPDAAVVKQQDQVTKGTVEQVKGAIPEKSQAKIKPVDVDSCYSCHKDIKEFHAGSKHSTVNCAQCHTDTEQHVAKDGKAPIGTRTDHAACGTCHQEQFNSFANMN